MDKIYIIIPVYNVEVYINRCLQSVLNQTYDNYEVILIDDGSTDNSGNICDEYQKKQDNIIVIHKENGGLSAARNTGIDYVMNLKNENSWITFIDSDDHIHPKYLEYLYYAADKSDANISCCYYIRTEQHKEYKDINKFTYCMFTPEEFWLKDRTNATLAWGKLYRTNLFTSVRYPKGKIHEDEFTTYKLLFNESSIAFVSEPLYFYWINMDGITKKEWNPARLNALEAFEEQIVYFKDNGHKLAYGKSYEALCETCILSIRYTEALAPKYNNLKKLLRKRLKNYLLGYGKEFGYRKAISLWFYCRVRKPLNRVLQNESIIKFLKRRIKKVIKRFV